jgi:hypothetical protein
VWTGSQMIVWGGYNGPSLNTGGRYNPTTDSWTATSTTSAPDARENHTAAWTGSQMIVWGGFNGAIGNFNTGGRYNPSTDSWTATSTTGAPAARASHTAVWTGSEVTIWGGLGSGNVLLNTGGRYCPAAPSPQVLYDQYNNAGTYATVSATFTDSPSNNSDLADDFVVPAGQTWNVQSIDTDGLYFGGSGPATDWNVFVYTDNAGFPSTQIYSALHQPIVQSGTTFTVNLPTPAVLTGGRYWVEIQANMTFSTQGEWAWKDRTVTSNNAAAWRNPGGGFGICQSWSRRGATCSIDPSAPDQVYRLIGTLGGATPMPNRFDFNGDGKTDYVLYNSSTRRTAVWYLNNNVYIGGAYAPILPVGWNLVDVADFNRDGNNDYALFNPSTRQTAIWYLSGSVRTGSAWGPTAPSGWTLAATGDFNGDRKPDYVLYNASTHQTAVWYLNNNVYIGGAYGPTFPAGWSLAGLADFNRDGKPDYLLFNLGTHYSVIWYLSGTSRIGSAYGPTITAGYNLTGAADFNSDFKPDYALYNASTGQTAIWYLNNNVRIGTASGPTLPAGWNLIAP